MENIWKTCCMIWILKLLLFWGMIWRRCFRFSFGHPCNRGVRYIHMFIYTDTLKSIKKQCFSSWALLTMCIYQVYEFSCCLPRHIRRRYDAGLEPNIWPPLNLEWMRLKMTCFFWNAIVSIATWGILFDLCLNNHLNYRRWRFQRFSYVPMGHDPTSLYDMYFKSYLYSTYIYIFIYYTLNGLRKEHQVNIQILHFLLENLLLLSLPGDFTAPPAWNLLVDRPNGKSLVVFGLSHVLCTYGESWGEGSFFEWRTFATVVFPEILLRLDSMWKNMIRCIS